MYILCINCSIIWLHSTATSAKKHSLILLWYFHQKHSSALRLHILSPLEGNDISIIDYGNRGDGAHQASRNKWALLIKQKVMKPNTSQEHFVVAWPSSLFRLYLFKFPETDVDGIALMYITFNCTVLWSSPDGKGYLVSLNGMWRAVTKHPLNWAGEWAGFS